MNATTHAAAADVEQPVPRGQPLVNHQPKLELANLTPEPADGVPMPIASPLGLHHEQLSHCPRCLGLCFRYASSRASRGSEGAQALSGRKPLVRTPGASRSRPCAGSRSGFAKYRFKRLPRTRSTSDVEASSYQDSRYDPGPVMQAGGPKDLLRAARSV